MWMSAPTCSATWRSSSVTAEGARQSTCESSAPGLLNRGGAPRAPSVSQARTDTSLLRGRPALDDLLIRHRHALGLLVGELRLRAVGLAEPLLRIHRLVQPRAAAAVDLGLLVHLLHARHVEVHLLGQAVHRFLRRERAGVDVTDLL